MKIFNRIFPDGLRNVELKTFDPVTRAEGVTLTRKQKDLLQDVEEAALINMEKLGSRNARNNDGLATRF